MNGVLTFLIALAVLATLGVLAAGVINMFRKGHDPMAANKLMRWRIVLQAAAIGLILLVLALSGR